MNEEVETKNEITMSGVNELQTGLFNESKVKRATTLNLNDDEESNLLLNGMQKCDYKLNDCIDKEIDVVGCYITERDKEDFDDATGEAFTYKKHTLMLFDADGKSYVTGSNSCYMSFMNIASIKGMPTKEHHLLLKPVKADALEKGHFYLKLQLVIKK